MLKIGLTGGIGCGKSIVAKFLNEQGIKIFSADQIAKEIMNSNAEVKSKLIAEFGAQIYNSQGNLDRKKVAKIIFSNNEARHKINAIVHPYVISYQKEQLKKIEESGETDIAGIEAALIYEAHIEHQFDVIVVVNAPLEMVIERLQKRDGLTHFEIMNRLQSQMPVEEKLNRADYIIENNGSIDDLKFQVQTLVCWLKKKVTENF